MFEGYGEVVVADEAPNAAEFRVAGDEGCEQCVGAYGPDPVAGVLGVGVKDEPVSS
jgi:hypothetical protein